MGVGVFDLYRGYPTARRGKPESPSGDLPLDPDADIGRPDSAHIPRDP
jgi:hypothetical protein